MKASTGIRGWAVAWLLPLGWASSAHAAIAFVQARLNAPQVTGATSVTATYSAAQTAGNLNVVIVGFKSPTLRVSAITDSKGNTYSLAVGPSVSNGNATQYIYYAKNIVAATANSNTITVTFNGSVPYPDLRMAEYSGMDTVSPLDVTAAANAPASAFANSGNATTTNANNLLIGGSYSQGAVTAAGSGYTSRGISAGGNILEEQLVAATGSYSATAASNTQINLSWTASTDNVGVTNYLIERCQGASCTTFAQTATSTTTS